MRPITLAICSMWSTTALRSDFFGSALTYSGTKLTYARKHVSSRLGIKGALSWRNGTRTITTPSRWPGPMPTCRSISSGTFRETSHTARAPEWLHITGAREILSAASAVASDVCERSTRTPRRLSSPTSVSPNWLSPRVQFSALERTGEGGEPEIGVAPEPVVEWLGCLQYSTRIRECVVAGVR